MTTLDDEERQRHTAVAKELLGKFTAATDVIDRLLVAHHGVLPVAQTGDDATRKQEIAEMDEMVFGTLNVMHSSIRALHNKIGDTHLFIDDENPYRLACRSARTHLEKMLSKHTAQPVSLGHFHDNLWEVAKQFYNVVKMDNVASSTEMKLEAAQKKPEPKKPARPSRVAGRSHGQTQGIRSAGPLPQYA